MVRLCAILVLALLPAAAFGQALDLNDDDILLLPLDQLPRGPNDPPEPVQGLDPLQQEQELEPEEAEPLPDPFADDPRAQIPDTAPPVPPADAQEVSFGDVVDAPKARLRGLDTLTNTVDDFQIAVGETLAFKRLIVTLEACRYPRGDLSKEAYAYVTIRDRREDAPRFQGWMLASSPALSALDHPRYDIWVLSCNTD